MRKLIVITVLVACAGAALVLYAWKKADVHHYPERRAWKNDAIEAITKDLEDRDIYRVDGSSLIRPDAEFLSHDGKWLTRSAIAFEDGDWMVYRQQCHKADPKVHDIFIGRGADGNWYYSDDHFCINALILASRGQPESIDDFKNAFHLVKFDGQSDVALESTQN